MNYTTNYHLPQWVETDRILMGDFNDAMSGIDGGIAAAKAAADTAESKADAAQSTADTAESKADAAQSTASNAYCPENKPYVIGTYSGNGGSKLITLGFRPSFVIVSGDTDESGDPAPKYTAMFSSGSYLASGSIENNGFEVAHLSNFYPSLSAPSVYYRYIAFR